MKKFIFCLFTVLFFTLSVASANAVKLISGAMALFRRWTGLVCVLRVAKFTLCSVLTLRARPRTRLYAAARQPV